MKRHLPVRLVIVLLALLVGSNWTELRAQEPVSEHFLVPEKETAADWVVETVEAAKWFPTLGDHSLVLDAAGLPRIAYGSWRFLYYAWYDGSAWQIQSVDTSTSGFIFASLALDLTSRPHISYYSMATEQVRYAYYDGMAWQIETVDTMPVQFYSGYTSLALDTAGHPHISYCSDDLRQVRYAHFDGTAWQIETVDYLGSVYEGRTSLALDPSGRPHIAYDRVDGTAYASYDGAAWQKEIVDPRGSRSVSLLLDLAGQPHLAYTNWLDGYYKYARNDGAGWQITAVARSDYLGDISLALTPSSLPRVAYASTYEGLRYAQYDGTTWQVEVVNRDKWQESPSLAVDDADHPRIVLLTVSSIRYIEYDGLAWQTKAVDYSEQVGSGSSLVLDSANRPHVSYTGASSTSSLKYAYYDGRAWQVQCVDTDVSPTGTSLALDTAGRPHIAYWGDSSRTLRYAYHDGTAWQLAPVDRVWCPGDCDLALALDLFGRPHIAYRGYWDSYTAGLKYAYYDGTRLQLEVVDEVGYEDNAYDLSLAVNAAGQPSISYSDAGALKYAQYRDGGWQIETVGVGRHTSLVLDAAGRPHLSYRGAEGLAYAYYDGAGWQEWEVDNDLSDIEDSSLALDAQGRPHISYARTLCFGPCFYSIQYASQSEGRWFVDQVDFDAFAPAPLVLGPDGWPHIVYRSSGLKYASLCEPFTQMNVSGPARLPTGVTGTFTAAYWPASATPPIFTWDNGSVGFTASYNWPLTGTYAVTATGGNGCSELAGSTSVEVFCQPLQSLSIMGPQTWVVNSPVDFRVAVEPITASLPMTLTWGNGASGQVAPYSWTTPGTYTVSLAAANLCSQLEETVSVRVLDGWPYRGYLPLVLK